MFRVWMSYLVILKVSQKPIMAHTSRAKYMIQVVCICQAFESVQCYATSGPFPISPHFQMHSLDVCHSSLWFLSTAPLWHNPRFNFKSEQMLGSWYGIMWKMFRLVLRKTSPMIRLHTIKKETYDGKTKQKLMEYSSCSWWHFREAFAGHPSSHGRSSKLLDLTVLVLRIYF